MDKKKNSKFKIQKIYTNNIKKRKKKKGWKRVLPSGQAAANGKGEGEGEDDERVPAVEGALGKVQCRESEEAEQIREN